MLMSFYGSIDKIMAGSGIDKLYQNIYGENSVKHYSVKLTGTAVVRANETYIFTESALLMKLQQIRLSESADSTYNVHLEVIQKLYKTILSKETDVDLDIPEMQFLRTILESMKTASQKKSQTARLWVQYIESI